MSRAAAWAHVDVFDHEGPWTEQDYVALPEDRRVELLDEALLVNPPPGVPHQRLSRNLTWRPVAAAPAGMEVLESSRCPPGSVVAAVLSRPGRRRRGPGCPA